MWSKGSQVSFVQCFYNIHIHVWAMRYKLYDFGEFTDELNALKFTFKIKTFIFLYLEGLNKTPWQFGGSVDCDKKNPTNFCFLVLLTDPSSCFWTRDTEFSFCIGSHNHMVLLKTFQLELCASLLPIKAKKHYISAIILLNYGKWRSHWWLFKSYWKKFFEFSRTFKQK